MPINNSKVTLAGIDLQVNVNGVVAHKVQIVDDAMPWVSRQSVAAIREDDDSQGFDVTMLTGKRVRVYYGTSAVPIVPVNNNSQLDSIYKKVLYTGFDVSGVGLSMQDASTIFAKYKDFQAMWGKKNQLLAQIQDPDITRSQRESIVTALGAIKYNAIDLEVSGLVYNVLFAEGMTCQFTNWVVGNYTDFSFNLIQRELLI